MTREEAITTLKEMHESFDEIHENTNGDIGYEQMTALDMAIEALSATNLKEEFESAECEDYEHATLVDIKEPLKVQVVRCKDCRHAYFKDFDKYCPYMVSALKPDGYCSHGEREK